MRLTERFLHHDPPSGPRARSRPRAAIGAELDRAAGRRARSWARGAPERRLIGLAGTVSTLSALDQGLAHYDR